MTAPDRHDLSQLSALLSSAVSPAKRAKAPKARPVAANDNKPTPAVLAWPALERLAYRGDMARAFALRHWKNLCQPGSVFDPTPTADDAAEEQIEVRPSEAETLRAIGWTVTGEERWPDTGRLVNTYEPKEATPVSKRNRLGGTDTRLGDLLFRDGKLIQWAVTAKGKALAPIERPRGLKGGQTSERAEAAIWAYLRTADAGSPFSATSLRRPFSGEKAIGECYDPLPREAPSKKDKSGRFGVEEARALLREHGVDGSVPFEELPVPAIRGPDALVPGKQWRGGIKKPKPVGEISAAAGREPEVVRLVEARSHLDNLRKLLGDHARVLDLAIGNATAREIGIAMGKAPAYAEKVGPMLIDAAIDALLAIDETARTDILAEERKIAA
ncbi:hypothetical protein F4V91_08560 [Neorhizobium galegae]|uniref:Uncharacterized protein n=1 Tax=Neorhizobium galegae TaxID=399 RepID=A0A6A1TQH0_NEOGA|nr:hypothetical protein [Neorhizobium galegae]KAB1086476.1 hypothetical protein F4V91_08560 [Neorhizobium galegae]